MSELENLTNELESRRVDSATLERICDSLRGFVPEFKTAMGSDADHTELMVRHLADEWQNACALLDSRRKGDEMILDLLKKHGVESGTIAEGIIKLAGIAHSFNCFRCRDGNAPLYCLNCAGDLLRGQL